MKIIRNTADSIFRTITLIVVYMLVSVSETFFWNAQTKEVKKVYWKQSIKP
ncbi:hypothetical protein ACT7DP_12525 [Bacillus paranthracis]